eukprot:CAMPEP_0178666982 /NCGR_PEP_ID=MMETSP0698-20121128/30794_1 /TAXON_ID=265572 /ORGANISM="Extubocellulus spinifer, Strain CCMP396" /LENGTH=354 /DNA_ID=CAMNT_0020310433 /DNA_START=223 /DNA_END=1287 /DNA_ORIENTATION=+
MGPSLRCPSNLKSRIRNSPPSRADRSRHVRNVLSEPDVNTEQRAKSSSTTSLEASSPRVKGDQSPPESKRSSRRPRKKIKVKREKTESEKRATAVRQSREAQYQELRALAEGAASVWGFESLFPATVWDDVSVYRDLYEVNDRDGSQFLRELANKENASVYGNGPSRSGSAVANQLKKLQRVGNKAKIQSSQQNDSEEKKAASSQEGSSVQQPNQKQRQITNNGTANSTSADAKNVKVDPVMTRMVEDKVYGFRRSPAGDFEYDTSLMGDGAKPDASVLITPGTRVVIKGLKSTSGQAINGKEGIVLSSPNADTRVELVLCKDVAAIEQKARGGNARISNEMKKLIKLDNLARP